jgi:hypothetical protein
VKSKLRRSPIAILAALLVALLGTAPAAAQVNIDAYRDYFLVGQFGEVCTMCEVIVVCQAGNEPPAEDAMPAAGDFTLYDIQTRTFWSQVSTIWEWFIANFSSDSLAARGHTRPVHEYTVVDGVWSGRQVIDGRLILDPGVLEFGAHTIDRVTRQWQRADSGAAVGYCSRLPLWESLEAITANAPGGTS